MSNINLYLEGKTVELDHKPTPLEELIHRAMVRYNDYNERLRMMRRPRHLTSCDIEDISDNYQANLEYQWERRDCEEGMKETKEIVRVLLAMTFSYLNHPDVHFEKFPLVFYKCLDFKSFSELCYYNTLDECFATILSKVEQSEAGLDNICSCAIQHNGQNVAGFNFRF